jgi:tetratricopeptide (TPR) repeat protein
MSVRTLHNKTAGWLALGLSLGLGLTATLKIRAQDAEANLAVAHQMIADQLADLARVRATDPNREANRAALQAMLLLKRAVEVAPDYTDGHRLLAVAAQALNDADTEREALRNLVRIDPGHLVGQARYVQLLAARAQTVDGQLGILDRAIEKMDFHPTIKSELALAMARLYNARGQTPEAIAYLRRALQLNDTNVNAGRELFRLQSTQNVPETEQLPLLLGLLKANPFQPEVVLIIGQILSRQMIHSQAANWYGAAIEQIQASGRAPTMDLFIDFAYLMATADRKPELDTLLKDFNRRVDVPLEIMLLEQALANPGGRIEASLQELPARVSRKLDQNIATAGEQKTAAIVESTMAELLFGASRSDRLSRQIGDLETLLPKNDVALQRVQGWQMIREARWEQAAKVLTPLIAKDPWAALGLARILQRQNDTTGSANMLRMGWSLQPTGLAAVSIASAAKASNINLRTSAAITKLENLLRDYPTALLQIHRSPRDLILMTGTIGRRQVGYGQPATVDVRVINSAANALAVGPGGAFSGAYNVRTDVVGLAGTENGWNLVENSPRVFRLEPRDALVLSIRIDQGNLRLAGWQQPLRTLGVNINVISEPITANGQIAPGLGGQVLRVGDYQRTGLPLTTPEIWQKALDNLETLTLPARMQLLSAAVVKLSQNDANTQEALLRSALGGGEQAEMQRLETVVTAALKSDKPEIKVWLVLQAPASGLPKDVEALFEQLTKEPKDAMVRMASYERLARMQPQSKDNVRRKELAELLLQFGQLDKDPINSQWAKSLGEELMPKTVTPASR